MEIQPETKVLRQLLRYGLTGLAAGFINGLVGTGAGVVFLLFFSLTGGGMSKAVFSVSMACVIPLSAVSLLTYPPPSSEILALLPWLFCIAGLGGLLGAWIQKRVQVRVLKLIFAALTVWAGWNMMV